MDPSAYAQFFAAAIGLGAVLFVAEAQEVVAEGGGEGGEGAVGTGIAGGHHAQHEHYGREGAEMEGDGGEYLVAHHGAGLVDGQWKAGDFGIGDKGGAKAEEEDVDHDEEQAAGEDVFLRVAQVFAGEVLLHHVLVEACHGDGDEHAADDLFPEVLAGGGVGFEDAGVAVLGRALEQLGVADVELFEYGHHGHQGGQEQEGGLQQVGPHHGLHAAAEGVEEDDGNEDDGRHPEGDAPGLEDKFV